MLGSRFPRRLGLLVLCNSGYTLRDNSLRRICQPTVAFEKAEAHSALHVSHSGDNICTSIKCMHANKTHTRFYVMLVCEKVVGLNPTSPTAC